MTESFEAGRARAAADVMEHLLERVAFARLEEGHRAEVRRMCRETLAARRGTDVSVALGGDAALDAVADGLADEAFAFKDFYALLQDDGVADVLVNGRDRVYVERGGRLSAAEFVFPAEADVLRIARWMTTRIGRPVSEDRPMVDARLPDGSRINVVIPPLAIDGTVLSIRRFRRMGLDLDGLAGGGSVPLQCLPLLRAAVAARLNVLVSGGTGAGKTTFLNALSAAIGDAERVVTIEDSAELQLARTHVVRLETRPAGVDGTAEVTTRALVRNALRMRPDRILVGEVRGPETIDMLQAMNTGHEGSMSTVHANSPRDALARLETMVGMSDVALDERAAKGQIARSIDMIIQLRRLADGRRVVEKITEVGRLQGDVITLQDIVSLEVRGTGPDGRAQGRFRATGVRPAFADRIERAGHRLDPAMWRFEHPLG